MVNIHIRGQGFGDGIDNFPAGEAFGRGSYQVEDVPADFHGQHIPGASGQPPLGNPFEKTGTAGIRSLESVFFPAAADRL